MTPLEALDAARRAEEGGRSVTPAAAPRTGRRRALAARALLRVACLQRPAANPNIIVVGITSGPNNLDPRIGTDDVSQKIAQLIFDNLMALDDHLQVVAEAGRAARASRSAHLRGDAAPRRALPRRPRADRGRRRPHVPSLLDPAFVVAEQRRAIASSQSVDAARPLHRRLHAEGAVRVVPDQPGDADRAGGRRPGRCASIRSAPDRIGSCGTQSTTASSSRPFDGLFRRRARATTG